MRLHHCGPELRRRLGVRERVRLGQSLLWAVVASGCAPTGEVDPSWDPPLRATDDCPSLVPSPRGPPENRGLAYTRFALRRSTGIGPGIAEWVQPAQPAQPVHGWQFFVSTERWDEEWCYAHPDDEQWSVVCHASDLPTALLTGLSTLARARVVATLDHAERLFEDAEMARRCTPVPPTIEIAPPHVNETGGLVFVEELRLAPDYTMMVQVEWTEYETSRAELFSWNPQEHEP